MEASKLRVLVLDDDRDFCELLGALLQSSTGAECLTVHSLDELLGKETFALACDLAILDVNLGPNKPSGIDALAWFRARAFAGLPELAYPFHDRDIVAAQSGMIALHGRSISISSVLGGQRLGLREVDTDVWLVSFMHYDLGYIDLEACTLQTIENPFGARRTPVP